ncbi:hypothetical protein [Oribacterium sp. NK2B42]|uniref:hypothetical protein n=1 Tax=Oribacterium sp. NK2B42 TaxID=689781 RepID=UPI0003FF502C|nr:hypothetical protein [Oribacterium sp. NK2B42]
MYDVELHRTERILKFRNTMGLLKNRDVYLFGVSDNSRQIIQILRECGIEPRNVIDNDSSKQGSYCSRLKVISFDEIQKPDNKKNLYIIYSAYWREMVPQLTDKGILKKNIWRLNRKPGLLLLSLFRAYRGRTYYKALKRKYGDVPVFICPYTGTGDIYLIGTFWDEYTKRNNINDYVFVVISKACKKVADLFDIKNIEVVKKKEYASYLIEYHLYDPEKGKMKLLNDCWAQVHTNQVEWFRGYKGLYFTDLFRRFVFELPDDIKPKHPTLKNANDIVRKIFEEHGLISKKTVILSPYSNTLSDLPTEFWEELASRLAKKGYRVATNSGGKTEPAIMGTVGVFFPLDVAPQIIEEAGAFVGVRSGFCDVISGTKAKKVILYDKSNRFYMGSAFEYFSLRGMKLCDDAVEIEYEHNATENIAEQIAEII